MKIYDISVPISPCLPVYPGDPPVAIDPVTRISRGDIANVSRLTLSTHAGTHIDPPLHFNDHGVSVDHLPLSLLIGRARVLELENVMDMGERELSRLPVRGEERLLLKTGNSRLWQAQGFVEEHARLTESGAAYLAGNGVRLLGIDYLSVEGFAGDGSVHKTLLSRGVVILEGLNLEGVPPGHYQLCCLPLKIKGGDGAPARAVLISDEPASERREFEPHTSRWPLS